MEFWLARDEEKFEYKGQMVGVLSLFFEEPYEIEYGPIEEPTEVKMYHEWESKNRNGVVLDPLEFPEVTYENSPVKMELVKHGLSYLVL